MTDPSATFDDAFTKREGPRGTRFQEIRTFPVLDSTNRYLKDQAAAGAREGLVAMAQQQTAGRGRHGRVWDSKPGASLLLSVLMRPQDVNMAQRVSNAMGLAVTDACRVVAGFDTHLKWPNDVVVLRGADGGYRKLAGVLAELVTSDDGEVDAVVVGVGVNLNWAGQLPEALRATAVSADELHGGAVDVEVFVDGLLRALHERLSRPTWLMQAYRERCATLGQQVDVTLGDEVFSGTAVELDDHGALVVESSNGERRTVTAGDVTHMRPNEK
jgi:BirA family biotin operon repressor/biotin-[acetyl-CoA-carboxylase] ligase